MKYEGKIEISKDEMDCLFGWLEKFIKLDRKLTSKVSQVLDQATENLKIKKENIDELDSNDSEIEDDSLEWEDEEPSLEHADDIHEPINLEVYSKKEDDIYNDGKRVACELFEAWAQNFKDEEKEQPDRGSLLKKLTITRSGQKLYKFFVAEHEKGKDTTLIMREFYDETYSDEDVRAIALHFTQVSSIIFHQLSDFLAYPNPLDED